MSVYYFPFLCAVDRDLLFPSGGLLPMVEVYHVRYYHQIVTYRAILNCRNDSMDVQMFMRRTIISRTRASCRIRINVYFIRRANLRGQITRNNASAFALYKSTRQHFKLANCLTSSQMDLRTINARSTNGSANFTSRTSTINGTSTIHASFPNGFRSFLRTNPLTMTFMFRFHANGRGLTITSLIMALRHPLTIFLLRVFHKARVEVNTIFMFTILYTTIRAN